ncbi:hypothetical protein MASR2M117_02890 [Paludibacter sp.]
MTKHKFNVQRVLGVLLLTVLTLFISAQSVKREVRATWLSTVWRLDWPSTTVPAANGTNEASRETARTVQKNGLISILNKLQAANFNTVFFQVRGMSDAFYNSAYEPWSQYLSSERGADPGWDPLQFIIDEAHARGIEVHAWLNPYRYSTSSESHGNLPTDYANTNPEWILDYGSFTKILNPGIPEVRKRICDVTEDIITKYDVDGIVFDDYFYVSGTTDAMDQAQFEAYNPKGLSRGDWRRANVNQMVKDVYARINSIKPYVTFGISPAGVAASSAAVANSYGLPPAPAGSDWQYNSIYSDPLAWLKDGSIDYISPQIYWTIGSANDFSKLSPWWAKAANLFGRHFYSSNTSNFSNTELINQVNVNRNADLNGATGSVYFRTNDLVQSALNALKAGPYSTKVLRAAYGWKTIPSQGLVENLTANGNKITWTYADNKVRYSIYAIPNANYNDAGIFSDAKYLVDISYIKEFTLPSGISTSTHKIAVAVYDKYGYEHPPKVLGESTTTTNAAQLNYPADAQNVVLPALLTWQPVANAAYYICEIAEDVNFTKPIAGRETLGAEFNSGLQTNLKDNTTYFWRVKTITPNAPAVTSQVRSFIGTKFKITSPADGSDKISMTTEISWMSIGQGANYTLEVSNKPDFSNIAYSVTVQTTSATVPTGKLTTSTTYYARVKAVKGDIQAISERISFVTESVHIPVPILILPADGVTVYGTSIQVSWQEQVSQGFRAELSKDPSFPTRQTTLKAVDAFVNTTSFDGLSDATYYVRVRAKNSDGLTEPSASAMVILKNESGIKSIHEEVDCYAYADEHGSINIVLDNQGDNSVSVYVYSISGIVMEKYSSSITTGKNNIKFNLNNYNPGIYLLKIKTDNKEKTLKIKL